MALGVHLKRNGNWSDEVEGNGVTVWLQKQLKPLEKNLEKVPPEAFAWLSLGLSLVAGVLLYFSQAQYWPALALFAGLVLALRLMSDSCEEMLTAASAQLNPPNLLIIRLGYRLADITMLLGFAFWDSLRIHLVLCAIVSMLLVSYVAELGRALGAKDCGGGLLCKSNRIILLIFFCSMYLFRPNARIADFSVFEVMFALFIPMASITLLQRLDAAIRQIYGRKDGE